jgi:antitoxin (DNA-binding transcriptional repressor) of toxin-antitoxin stability system
MLAKMKYHTVHEAKTDLSELIRKACNGEEVIIARGHQPVVKLVPVGDAPQERIPGGFEGKISWTPDAFDPLTDEEMRELGFE